MKRIGSALAGLALVLAAPAIHAQAGIVWSKSGPTSPMTITSGTRKLRFKIEKAITEEQQERGLMFRKVMAPDHGMIFPMNPPRPASFWMKNTYIPLDIIFIGSDHRILQISANAKPLSLDHIDCYSPVAAVLELGGGVAKKMHIKEGDKVGLVIAPIGPILFDSPFPRCTTPLCTAKPARMAILKRIFTWWDGATIGTLLYSRRNGRSIGSDALGNHYFESKSAGDAPSRRWVIYSGANDASRVPAEWHGWLHHTTDLIPETLPPAREWEKESQPNLTGTAEAWRPAGALERGGNRAAATGDYEAWSPAS